MKHVKFAINDSAVHSLENFDELLAHASIRSFSQGEAILSPSTDKRVFYYVISGAVEVKYTDQFDTQITVALIGTGEFFGEIGFFDGESRVRDIQAAVKAKVGIFDETTMAHLKEENPTLYMDFLLLLTQKICGKFRRIIGEREPITGYAESLSTRRSMIYTDTKPIPSSLIHSTPWHSISSKMEAYKAELFNLSHALQRKEAEGIQDSDIENRCSQVLLELNGSLVEFEQVMEDSGYLEVMWGYIFKEIFPYFMRSYFAERAYYKPKGYAGDFLMMEHIYKNQAKGDGKLGEIIDDFCLQRPGSLAIRGRRRLLKEKLMLLGSELAEHKSSIRIMNLACGSNRELFDFLAEFEHTHKVEATCVDIDPEALQYTNQHVNIHPHRASVRLMSENIIKWSLGRVRHQLEKQDVIYSAGLCDYLDERLFQALINRCHEQLNPGGVLLLGNFTFYPDSLFLDKLLRWQLIYRTEENLKEIFAPTSFGDRVTILSEKEHVNLFAMARKE